VPSMTLAGMSNRKRSAKRRIVFRAASAVFGICVFAAVIVADTGIRPGNSAALTDDFPQLQASVKAAIGIVLAPVGGSGTPLSLGNWHSGPAWSTIKVPLVMAALREEQPPYVTELMTAAITQSDNAAAEAIWVGLGDPASAARKVEAVLAAAGDPTQVQSQRVRPDFTAFGQTDWSLVNQVRFLSAAACDSRNTPVLTLMGQVERDQRWGLGHIPGTRFKGGWGPSPTNKYLDRQMGLITTPRGTSVAAIAAEPYSGAYEDGIRVLNQIANWLANHIVTLPSGRCHH
jgi:hypothetical protein